MNPWVPVLIVAAGLLSFALCVLVDCLSRARWLREQGSGKMRHISRPEYEDEGPTETIRVIAFRVPPYVAHRYDPDQTRPLTAAEVWGTDYQSNGRGVEPTRRET